MLDIGCAYGYFLKLCDEVECETYGVDISENAIQQAQKETKAVLFIHDVNNGLSMFPKDFLNLITMFDVIEHLNSPFTILKEISRKLKVGGKLIITTPNANALERLLKKVLNREKNWHGFKDKTHQHLFTPLTLRFIVEKAGLKILKVETPFHPLPKILQKLLNKTEV